jgi:hypothetical protein
MIFKEKSTLEEIYEGICLSTVILFFAGVKKHTLLFHNMYDYLYGIKIIISGKTKYLKRIVDSIKIIKTRFDGIKNEIL